MSYRKDFEGTYKYIDWMRNTEVAQVDDQQALILLPGFGETSWALIAMEGMARELEDKRGWHRMRPPAPDLHDFSALGVFQKCYAFSNRGYVFSPYVDAIRQALQALSLRPEHFTFCEPRSYDRHWGVRHAAMFEKVKREASEIILSNAFADQLSTWEQQIHRNETQGLAIERQVFDELSRCWVVARTFGLQSGGPSPDAPAELFEGYCQTFLNLCGTSAWVNHALIDYVWFIDDKGEASSAHLHVLFFYQAEWDCLDEIRDWLDEAWTIATDDAGRSWSSYAGNVFHEERGYGICTGEVDRLDHEKREVLRQNIRYMARASQFLHVRHWRHYALFGTCRQGPKETLSQLLCVLRQTGAVDTDASDLDSPDEIDESEERAQCAAADDGEEA